tara:strand:+ start:1596 stop:2138 length:543 start_codon:yes stop_codon:yes gene_type:complete
MITETAVWRVIIAVINNGLIDQGITGVKAKQSYQQTQQGTSSADRVYLNKVTQRRISHQSKEFKFNEIDDNFDHKEAYWLAVTYQLNAVINQDLSDPDSMTVGDLVDICGAILQSTKARKTLLESGVGILKINDTRNPFFSDDSKQFVAEPSFDFVLTYNQSISSKVPKISAVEETTINL